MIKKECKDCKLKYDMLNMFFIVKTTKTKWWLCEKCYKLDFKIRKS